MKRAVLLLITVCLLLTACGPGEDYPAQVGGVTFAQAPERVVSLSPMATRMMVQLGFASSLVGVGEMDATNGLPDGIPDVGTQRSPDTEAIRSCSPDVILVPEGPVHADLLALRQEGIPVVYVPAAASLADIKECAADLCTLFLGNNTGKEKAEAYIGAVETSLQEAAVEEMTYLYFLTEDGVVAAPESTESELLALCGLINAAPGNSGFVPVREELAARTPDVIFVDSGVDVKALQEDPVLGRIPAVQEGRIFTLSDLPFVTGDLQGAQEAILAMIPQLQKGS